MFVRLGISRKSYIRVSEKILEKNLVRNSKFMNKKIKEFAKQAGQGEPFHIPAEFIDKFAELIVRDCAMFSMVITDDHYDVDALYKHFGVTE